MSSEMKTRIDQAADFLRGKWAKSPRAGVILGTGLGSLSASMTIEARVPYDDIPHFAVSTVESHAGEMLFGQVAGRDCVVMSGRVHLYEGYTMEQVTFPVRVMRALGAPLLIVSNAVGGMNPLFGLGDICITVDHINLMGANPLIGPNDDALGPRFPDMSEPYTLRHVASVERIALDERIQVRKGVFVAVAGPNLETRAEYRFLRTIGADVVGMSLVPEVLVAVHGGMEVLALSVVTDLCLPDALEPVDIQRILQVAADAEPKLTRLVSRFLEDL
ncbi:MAG: purine-nucleoside phosphorylase [Candidatus Eisenbacteria bacterium]|nr:purine-nucleoside phosphorylase [Candidatus Eisenbacteria bacterium]MCC7140727.1 purine-nucleoside phosphorylase [Candidatus Eisenbacteria bacterium]